MRARRLAILAVAAILAVPGGSAAQATGALTLDAVTGMLQARFNTTQILAAANQRCLAFRITSSNESTLKEAGADSALIEGLRGACSRVPAREVQPAAGILEIVGYLPPGWERTVNAAFLSSNRIIELTRPGDIVVRAPGYCPAGTTAAVPPGERQEWAPTLRARPWVGECPDTDR